MTERSGTWWIGAGLAVALGACVAGCSGGSSGGGGGSTPTTVSGSVVANFVSGATVRVYRIEADRSLTLVGEGTTDADGGYTLDVDGDGPFYVVAGGGTYRDEASGASRSLAALPSGLTQLDAQVSGLLTAVIGEGESTGASTVSLTPLTTLAARRTIEVSQSDGDALSAARVAEANTTVASEFGISGDPRAVTPLDLSDPDDAAQVAGNPDGAEARLGAVLAALSQSAESQGLSEPLDLVDALAEDYRDGVLDGQSGDQPVPLASGTLSPTAGTSDLSGALETFLGDETANASGTDSQSFAGLIDAVETVDTAPAGGNAQPRFDPIADVTVAVDAGPQGVQITGVDAGAGDTGQAVSFSVTSSGTGAVSSLTVTDAAGGTGGGPSRVLSFTPSAVGVVNVQVTAQDDGGTADNGVDTLTRTFTITISDPAPPAPPTGTPGVDWAFGLATVSSETVVGVRYAPDGDVVVAGQVQGASAQSVSQLDLFVVKLAPDGTQRWRTDLVNTGIDALNGMAIDGSGNIYLAGDADADPSSVAGTATSAVVVQLSAAGAEQWTQTLDSGSSDRALSVAATGTAPNQLIVVGGVTEGGLVAGQVGTNGDAWLARLDGSGNPVWVRQEGSAAFDRATAVAVSGSGLFAMAVTSPGNLGTAPLGGDDVKVYVYGSDGSDAWSRVLATGADDAATALTFDFTGNLYVAGTTRGGFTTAGNAGGLDGFVQRYSSAGDAGWMHVFATPADDVPLSLHPDSPDLLVAGSTAVSAAGGVQGNTDGFVRRVDATGTATASVQLGGAADDRFTGVTANPNGGVFVCGDTLGDALGLTNQGLRDAFVASLGDVR